MRVHRKGEDELSLIELAATVILQIARWLPDGRFRLVADGAYPSLVGYDVPRTVVVTRLRRNAALNELAPARTGRRERPCTKVARACPLPFSWRARPPAGHRSRSASVAR